MNTRYNRQMTKTSATLNTSAQRHTDEPRNQLSLDNKHETITVLGHVALGANTAHWRPEGIDLDDACAVAAAQVDALLDPREGGVNGVGEERGHLLL